MEALDFWSARRCVIDTVRATRTLPLVMDVPLADAAGRVLAVDVQSDRDYPTLDRSIRDGFAVRAADMPGPVLIAGEVRAGGQFAGVMGAGECIRIMTGAPVPAGADAVVMVEHATVADGRMMCDRTVAPGQFINRAGAESSAGELVLQRGTVLRHNQIALLATVGVARVPVLAKPRVAILATGDELAPVEATPRPFEIRNSNSWALAALVAASGGIPVVLPVAPDDLAATRAAIEAGLQADLLLLSGGVSAGDYDFVEAALAELHAEFYFTRVQIRPGAPVVFGRAAGRFFFGLPGNPLSTAVTFRVFAQAALELLCGVMEPQLNLLQATLGADLHEKPGLTRFLPAVLAPDRTVVMPLHWKGSSDVATFGRANALIVADAERGDYSAGDIVSVLML